MSEAENRDCSSEYSPKNLLKTELKFNQANVFVCSVFSKNDIESASWGIILFTRKCTYLS